MDDTLASDDLVGLIVAAAVRVRDDVPWCCPPLGRVQPSKPRVVLLRAVRLRLVSRVWRDAIFQILRAARAFEMHGCDTVCGAASLGRGRVR